jgi:hypothetical protein
MTALAAAVPGAKAQTDVCSPAARLKPCPDTKLPPKAGFGLSEQRWVSTPRKRTFTSDLPSCAERFVFDEPFSAGGPGEDLTPINGGLKPRPSDRTREISELIHS